MISLLILTHIELANKTGHIIVLEVLWKNLFREPALIKHMEAGSILKTDEKVLLQ